MNPSSNQNLFTERQKNAKPSAEGKRRRRRDRRSGMEEEKHTMRRGVGAVETGRQKRERRAGMK